MTRTGYDGRARCSRQFGHWRPDVRLKIVDMFEEGDRAAVRWEVSGDGTQGAMIAVYQFAGARIVRLGHLGALALDVLMSAYRDHIRARRTKAILLGKD